MAVDLKQSLVMAVELSTAHLAPADLELLPELAVDYSVGSLPSKHGSDSGRDFRPAVLLTANGFVIPVGEPTVKAIKDAGASPELASILDACLATGDCMYLAFDSDGRQHEDLPVF